MTTGAPTASAEEKRAPPAGSAPKPAAPAPAPAPASTTSPLRPRTDKARAAEIRLPTPEERRRSGKAVLDRLKDSFLGDSLEVSERPGILARVRFPAEAVLRVMTWLRDQGTFTHCAMVAGIDWRESREVLYTLWSDSLKAYLELTTSIPAEDPHIESVSSVWAGAIWHEREAWDLLGIRFDHHPDLRRLFLPEGYKFHPLLKTFELHEPEDLEVKARLGR